MNVSVKTAAAKPAESKPAAAPAVTPTPKRRATVVKAKGATAKTAVSTDKPTVPKTGGKPKAGAKGKEKATAKSKPVAKEKAVKVEKVVVQFVPRTLVKGKLPFVIAERARPQSGSRLFAHTHAALTMLGALSETRPIIAKKSALTVMGQRAVNYHVGKGNFIETKDHGLQLTQSGLNMFKARLAEGKVDGGMANEFMALFIDGKPGNTGVDVGNVYQAAII